MTRFDEMTAEAMFDNLGYHKKIEANNGPKDVPKDHPISKLPIEVWVSFSSDKEIVNE